MTAGSASYFKNEIEVCDDSTGEVKGSLCPENHEKLSKNPNIKVELLTSAAV